MKRLIKRSSENIFETYSQLRACACACGVCACTCTCVLTYLTADAKTDGSSWSSGYDSSIIARDEQ